MDMHEIAEIIAPRPAGMRMRQGLVTAIATDGTVTVQISGSDVAVSDVKLAAHVCPKIGAGLWLLTDGVDWIGIATIGVGPAFCSVRRTVDQSIATGTNTTVSFGAAADKVDTHGMFDTGTPTQLTIQVPGIYDFVFGMEWDGNSTGYRRGIIYRNASAVAQALHEMSTTTAARFSVVAAGIPCAIGDVITAEVRHTAGVSLALVSAADYSPRLSAAWLRPVT